MIDYASSTPTDVGKRDRRYTVCTAVIGAMYVWGSASIFFLPVFIPAPTAGDKLFAICYGASGLVIGLALLAIFALRSRKPGQRSRILFTLNALVLIAFPFGTVLAVYYFMRLRPYDTQP